MPGDASAVLLGIDIGTTRTKAALLDAAGRIVTQASAPTPFANAGGLVEADVGALAATIAGVVRDLGPARGAVAGVGVAGVAESGAPFDRRGEPVGPVIAWHDPRGEEAVLAVQRRSGEGLPLRIGQQLRTVSSVAKLGWLAAQGVRTHRWLGVPELCLHLLTGAHATEHSLAARTGCYDVATQTWIEAVAAAAGVSVDVFPPVLPAGAVMGRVSAGGARWSGVPQGVPVTIAGHDHLAGAEALGGRQDDAFNSVGTAETVLRRTATLPDVARALPLRLAVTLRPGGKGWVVLASAARAGLVIDSAAHALGMAPAQLDALVDERRLDSAPGPDLDLDAVVAAAREGRRPPLPAAPPGDVWASLLNAVAARTADAVGRQHRLLPPARRLVVFGGGSASEPWLRAKARAVGMPVRRTPVPDAVARGAAVFAGVAAGWWPDAPGAPPPALLAVTGPRVRPGRTPERRR